MIKTGIGGLIGFFIGSRKSDSELEQLTKTVDSKDKMLNDERKAHSLNIEKLKKDALSRESELTVKVNSAVADKNASIMAANNERSKNVVLTDQVNLLTSDLKKANERITVVLKERDSALAARDKSIADHVKVVTDLEKEIAKLKDKPIDPGVPDPVAPQLMSGFSIAPDDIFRRAVGDPNLRLAPGVPNGLEIIGLPVSPFARPLISVTTTSVGATNSGELYHKHGKVGKTTFVDLSKVLEAMKKKERPDYVDEMLKPKVIEVKAGDLINISIKDDEQTQGGNWRRGLSESRDDFKRGMKTPETMSSCIGWMLIEFDERTDARALITRGLAYAKPLGDAPLHTTFAKLDEEFKKAGHTLTGSQKDQLINSASSMTNGVSKLEIIPLRRNVLLVRPWTLYLKDQPGAFRSPGERVVGIEKRCTLTIGFITDEKFTINSVSLVHLPVSGMVQLDGAKMGDYIGALQSSQGMYFDPLVKHLS